MIWYKGNGIFWFRLWHNGPGLKFKNLKKHPMLFSERNGYTKHIVIGNYFISKAYKL